MNQFPRDPLPDGELRDALASLDPPPSERVDWNRLHAAVRERAEMPLARRRRVARGAPRWLRAVIPAAAAAAIAVAVAVPTLRTGGGVPVAVNGEVPTEFHPVVEQVIGSPISELELDLLFGQVDADMLVVAAVDRP